MNAATESPPDLSRIAVIVPALNPEPLLLELVKHLLLLGFGKLILVDDGSTENAAAVFEAVMHEPRIEVLRHAVNCGKGRALKTAFNHCLVNLPEFTGVVTADADGQHSPADIARVAAKLSDPDIQGKNALVLGVRDFGEEVPFRSKFGNTLTCFVFRTLYGIRIVDTQTGLRAFPMAALKSLLTASGERYEYESEVLISAVTHKQEIVEVPIATIYVDNNRGSHFNPLLDSIRIYFVLLRFFAASLVTSIIDFAVFALVILFSDDVMVSMLAGRGVAISVNFVINKNIVFRQQGGGPGVFLRYLALVALLGGLSYLMISELQEQLGMSVLAAKLLAESILFILSFSVQREIVFVNRQLVLEKPE